jgi:hypothetical protein
MPHGLPSLRNCIALAAAVLLARPALAANTCAIPEPPLGAGEEAHMGELLLVYPHAKDIGATFTGCQSIWGRTKAETRLIGRFEYSKGSFVAVHDGAKRVECEYKNGQLKSGVNSDCPRSPAAPIPSLPPGCFSKVQRAVEMASARPSECDEYE